MRPQIICDVETTSLFADYASGKGTIWELGAIERGTGTEHLWRMKPDVSRADAKALEVGRFAERTTLMQHATEWTGGDTWDLTTGCGPFWSWAADLAPHVAGLLDGVTLIAANPTFDAGFLSAFLAAYGCKEAPWHYRLRDIGSMAWAWLQAHHLPHHLATPAMDASTDDLARAMGVDPEQFERHSALGDCRLVEAMLRVIEDGPRS
jgi:DNA polymerase III epsilon subunit-like protein